MLLAPLGVTALSLVTVLLLFFLTFFQIRLYTLNAETVSDIASSEKGNDKWLSQRLSNSANTELFFIVARALLLALLFVIIDWNFCLFNIDMVIRSVIEIIILLLILVFFSQVLPIQLAMKENAKKHQRPEGSPLVIFRVLHKLFLPLTFIFSILLKLSHHPPINSALNLWHLSASLHPYSCR
jgi:hypothetical protein